MGTKQHQTHWICVVVKIFTSFSSFTVDRYEIGMVERAGGRPAVQLFRLPAHRLHSLQDVMSEDTRSPKIESLKVITSTYKMQETSILVFRRLMSHVCQNSQRFGGHAGSLLQGNTVKGGPCLAPKTLAFWHTCDRTNKCAYASCTGSSAGDFPHILRRCIG